jgi:hypothetical protein
VAASIVDSFRPARPCSARSAQARIPTTSSHPLARRLPKPERYPWAHWPCNFVSPARCAALTDRPFRPCHQVSKFSRAGHRKGMTNQPESSRRCVLIEVGKPDGNHEHTFGLARPDNPIARNSSAPRKIVENLPPAPAEHNLINTRS